MLAATLLAIGSAFVHASWNLLLKSSDDRAIAGWGQFAVAGILGGAGLLVIGGPGWEALPYLTTSALIHVVYLEALVAAYEHGDFSLAYPLARGGGAVLAALGSVAFLDDSLEPLAWVAIAIAAAGLFATSATADAASGWGALGFAALTATAIGTYTLVDSAGSRAIESGASYGFAAALGAGTVFTIANLLRPSRRARAHLLRRDWRRHLVGGAAALTAYTMVLIAVRFAPVGYVTMLRESSVVLGPLLGWLLLREPLGKQRVLPAVVVLTGLVLLVAVET